MATAKIYNAHVLKFVTSNGGLAADATTTLDSNGDPMTLPRGFIIDDGFVHCTDGVATGTFDLGFSGGTVDSLIDGADPASGGVAARFAVDNVSETLVGVGASNAGATGNTLILTQRTATETGTPTITIYVMGHYEFDA